MNINDFVLLGALVILIIMMVWLDVTLDDLQSQIESNSAQLEVLKELL